MLRQVYELDRAAKKVDDETAFDRAVEAAVERALARRESKP